MSRGKWSNQEFAGLPSLSVAAHELKTPITLMRQLGLLLSDSAITDAERASYQTRLVTIAEQSLRLVNDLAQIGSSTEQLFDLEPVNPLAVCRSLKYEVSPLAKLYGREINWPKKSRSQMLTLANHRLLSSIISNFVDNALRYTDADVPVSVKVSARGTNVRVAVRDFGPRMSNREYRRIVDEMDCIKSIKTRPDSSGLGIFIASEFAKLMHGSIGLTRHRDGVTFYVDLPCSTQMSLI